MLHRRLVFEVHLVAMGPVWPSRDPGTLFFRGTILLRECVFGHGRPAQRTAKNNELKRVGGNPSSKCISCWRWYVFELASLSFCAPADA